MSWRNLVLLVGALAFGANSAHAGVVETHVGFTLDDFLIAPVFIEFIPGSGGGGGEGEGEGEGEGGEGGGGCIFCGIEGTIVESRLNLDMTIAPGASIEELEFILFVPIDDGGEFPIFPSQTFLPSDFTLEGDRLFGTVSTTALNGLIFPENELFAPLWTLQIPLPAGGFTVFGEGHISSEFDIIVPEPSALAMLVVGSCALIRRRGLVRR